MFCRLPIISNINTKSLLGYYTSCIIHRMLNSYHESCLGMVNLSVSSKWQLMQQRPSSTMIALQWGMLQGVGQPQNACATFLLETFLQTCWTNCSLNDERFLGKDLLAHKLQLVYEKTSFYTIMYSNKWVYKCTRNDRQTQYSRSITLKSSRWDCARTISS